MFARSHTLRSKEGWTEIDSGYDVHFYSSMKEIDEGAWNGLNSERNLFTSYNFLSTLEETIPDEVQNVYVLLRQNNKIAGGYVFQIIHLSPETCSLILQPLSVAGGIVGGLTDWIKKCREQKGMRVLISGNNYISGEHGIVAADGFPKAKLFRLLPKIVQRIIDLKSEPVKISLVLVKDFYAQKESRPDSVLKKSRYHHFRVEPEMVLSIRPDWKTYSHYESAMTKKYRNRSRSVMKKSSALDVRELSADEIYSLRFEIFSLYMAVHSNAKFRLAALTPEYFVQMKREFGSAFKLTIYTCDGRIVAFRSGFVNGKEYEAHFIGLDYTLNRDKCLYQRILYDFVGDSIECGSEKLLLGRTAAEIKSTVGAEPHDLECYMRHRNSLSNHIISPFVDYLKPEHWVQRNPFNNTEAD